MVHYGATARLEMAAIVPEGFRAEPMNRLSGELGPPWDNPEFVVVPWFVLLRVELFNSAKWANFHTGYEAEGKRTSKIHAYNSASTDVEETERGEWVFQTQREGKESPITITVESLFVGASELERFKTGAGSEAEAQQEIEPSKTESRMSQNRSDKLVALNQAFSKFWANADPSDRTTHEDNAAVEKWLIEKGYSQTLAQKGASIIRPGWAGTGRKPEK